MKYFIYVVLALFLANGSAQAQALWNKQIDDAQKVLCKRDSLGKCTIMVSTNTDVNLFATTQLTTKVDYWQKYITNSTELNANTKTKMLRVLLNYINRYNAEGKKKTKSKDFSPYLAKELFNDFDKIIETFQQKTPLATVLADKGVMASKIILANEYIKDMMGHVEAWDELLIKESLMRPETILVNVNKKPTLRLADSLIVIAAYNNQDKLYDFAQCTKCPVNAVIKRSENPLVKTLYTMAQMETGRSLTPFLNAISRGEITIDSINKIQSNQHAYFKLLVNTRINYLKRLEQGEEILALKNFEDKITEKALGFVREINELHTASDAVRFAVLNPLNAQELYYLAVYGIDELFTSSFNRGVFQQMVNKLNGQNTDQLLTSVRSDNFRKFIKISAGYNKLAQFLKLMPEDKAQSLMNRFVEGLVDDEIVDKIENAVDVADAYTGIGLNKDLVSVSNLILNRTKQLETQYTEDGNKKGQMVYQLLNSIFNSYKDTSIDISKQLNIAPITKVNYSSLVDAKNKVVVKLYFYGDEDKDGQYSYQNFMGLFGDKTKWTVKANKKSPFDFVEINSLKGNPIQIFANYPHYDATKKTDPDDTAKLRMNEYLTAQKIVPTFVMHRGHSYHVPITLVNMEQYDTAAKLIVLGSCGGYQNLQKVLEICPESHIVSSKQTGTMHVNDPMLRILFNDISAGKDIVWPDVWPRLRSVIPGDKMEMFDEYISPDKNLGMIFIKAYKKQVGI